MIKGSCQRGKASMAVRPERDPLYAHCRQSEMKVNPPLMLESDLLAITPPGFWRRFVLQCPSGLQQPCEVPNVKYCSQDMQPPQTKVRTRSAERNQNWTVPVAITFSLQRPEELETVQGGVRARR